MDNGHNYFPIERYYNDSSDVTITGLIVDEPDVRDRFTDVRVAAEEIVLRDGTAVPVSGIVQMRTFRYPELAYGMRLTANGRLETPPENSDFSYKDYLARQNVYSLMSLPFVVVLAEGEGSPVYHVIFAIKHHAQATIERLIPAPQSALLTGILLGNDNGMPQQLAEDFRTTGMTHIIAISGQMTNQNFRFHHLYPHLRSSVTHHQTTKRSPGFLPQFQIYLVLNLPKSHPQSK